MSLRALQIRARIFCPSTHTPNILPYPPIEKGGERHLPPLPYRQPGTMSREGTKRPLASPCNAFSAIQRGAKRFFHIESRSFTLQGPPAASEGEEECQYEGKHGAMLATHYAISSGLSSRVIGPVVDNYLHPHLLSTKIYSVSFLMQCFEIETYAVHHLPTYHMKANKDYQTEDFRL